MLLREWFVLDGVHRVELAVEGPKGYRLALCRGREVLVEYVPGSRRLRGRRTDYAFRSIEQLRYDFGQDLRDAGLA